MPEKTLFQVTAAAGPYVAGRKAKPGDIIPLSAAQAKYETALGSIVPHAPVLPLRTPEDGGAIDLATRRTDDAPHEDATRPAGGRSKR